MTTSLRLRWERQRSKPLAPRPLLNALTIDVEDYYHVSGFDHCVSRKQWDELPSRVGDSTRRLLDRLAESGVQGTFFILGWVAERQPSLVRAIHAAGHEIGCHGYVHRLIYEQTPQQFRVDLRLARLLLEDIIGEKVIAYRAPSFSIVKRSLWALDVLLEEGFLFDSSIYPTHHDRYGIAGTPLHPHRIERDGRGLWEFPPPVWRLLGYPLPIGGGGYFRLYPYGLTQARTASDQRRGPAVRRLSASVGVRSATAAPAARNVASLPALRRPAPDRSSPHTSAERFPLRNASAIARRMAADLRRSAAGGLETITLLARSARDGQPVAALRASQETVNLMLDASLKPVSSLPLARSSSALRVVIVDEELPYPPTSGKRIRTLNLTLRLARRHRLTYVCHRNADADEARQAAAFFAEHGIETLVVDRTVPSKSGPRFYLRLAANLVSPLPYSVATHNSRQLRRVLAELARKRHVDVWQCEWTPYAEALRGIIARRRVVIAHNVESVIWQRYHKTESNPLRRWYIGRQWRKFQRFERRVLGEVEHTVAVSDTDAQRLRDDFGVARLEVVENGVDTAYFQPQARRRQPNRLLFLGSLDWRPNLDGVYLLLERVFPAVRAAEPSARLCLVGRNPPEALRRLAAGMPGVELHGSVPDVRPYLADCGLLVVPLRIGGGSRLKILEALASGTPVVSTRIGAEGLHLEAGQDLTIVEDIDDLTRALVAGIRQPEDLLAQAERGREKVLEHYDWDQLADRLEQVWKQCASEPRNR